MSVPLIFLYFLALFYYNSVMHVLRKEEQFFRDVRPLIQTQRILSIFFLNKENLSAPLPRFFLYKWPNSDRMLHPVRKDSTVRHIKQLCLF